ncbi:helix-turn-helix transcriptional regulator [Candidatus Woesearchaeota archaeon]|nr:helix-turn-helix transcriptional regulator [Candidatus Woesearchaeota archaeon]
MVTKNRKIKLTLEEGKIVKTLIHKGGLNHREIYKELGIKQSYFSNILGGKRSIYQEKATKLYEILGCDSSVEFLREESTQHKDEIEGRWGSLYDSYTKRLKEPFSMGNLDVKRAMIGELEQMINKYEK